MQRDFYAEMFRVEPSTDRTAGIGQIRHPCGGIYDGIAAPGSPAAKTEGGYCLSPGTIGIIAVRLTFLITI